MEVGNDMKRIKLKKSIKHRRIAVYLCITWLVFSSSFAQEYQITRHLIGSGGGVSEFAPGVGFSVTGSIGQTALGVSQNPGSGHTIISGFWPAERDLIFTDGFDSNP